MFKSRINIAGSGNVWNDKIAVEPGHCLEKMSVWELVLIRKLVLMFFLVMIYVLLLGLCIIIP
jgi:hypothetical protein